MVCRSDGDKQGADSVVTSLPLPLVTFQQPLLQVCYSFLPANHTGGSWYLQIVCSHTETRDEYLDLLLFSMCMSILRIHVSYSYLHVTCSVVVVVGKSLVSTLMPHIHLSSCR